MLDKKPKRCFVSMDIQLYAQNRMNKGKSKPNGK